MQVSKIQFKKSSGMELLVIKTRLSKKVLVHNLQTILVCGVAQFTLQKKPAILIITQQNKSLINVNYSFHLF
jgi:hypothetical protein